MAELSKDKLADLRVAHLNIIQGVISRLSGFSASAKNFCVTITAALIALIFDKNLAELAGAGFAVIIVFLFIDCYYLALERRYRDVYDDVRKAPSDSAIDFEMKAKSLSLGSIVKATKSTSIWPFYAGLLACMIFFGYCSADGKRRPSQTVRPDRVTVSAKQSTAAATIKSGERGGELSGQLTASGQSVGGGNSQSVGNGAAPKQ